MSNESALVLDGRPEPTDEAGSALSKPSAAGSFPELNRGERNALRAYWPFQEFEPLSKRVRIGLPSMHGLVAKGLVEEGPAGVFGPTFRLTDRGRTLTLALAGLGGERPRFG
ncbi:MAG: hypothetical protein J7493_10945 [Porphyrobacter sp.]|nr:hypothetical protein [Porphyrobacter sp.]